MQQTPTYIFPPLYQLDSHGWNAGTTTKNELQTLVTQRTHTSPQQNSVMKVQFSNPCGALSRGRAVSSCDRVPDGDVKYAFLRRGGGGGYMALDCKQRGIVQAILVSGFYVFLERIGLISNALVPNFTTETRVAKRRFPPNLSMHGGSGRDNHTAISPRDMCSMVTFTVTCSRYRTGRVGQD